MVAAQSRDSVRGLLALALLAASCSDRPASVVAEPENSVDAGVEEWFTDLRNANLIEGEVRTRYHRIIDGLAAAGDRAAVRLQQLDE